MQTMPADIMLTSRPCSPAGEAGTTANASDAISESLGRISELVLADELPHGGPRGSIAGANGWHAGRVGFHD